MKFVKKTDFIVIVVIIGIALAVMGVYRALNAGHAAKAEIYYYGELVETVDLGTGEDRTFSIPQNEHVVLHVYSDGQICFESSDCPDQICVKSGKLSVIGQSAACLPNGIVLKIVPAGQRSGDDPDIVIGP